MLEQADCFASSRMEHDIHMLSHSNCRIEARRLLRLDMNNKFRIAQSSRNASLATIPVVLCSGPGYVKTINSRISWANSVNFFPSLCAEFSNANGTFQLTTTTIDPSERQSQVLIRIATTSLHIQEYLCSWILLRVS